LPSEASVVVVGGGVAGLAASHAIEERARRLGFDLELQCLEATDRPGGNIRTTREKGFLCEWGATGFLDNAPETLALARRLGLEARLVRAHAAAARRFILRKGKLREVPLGPGAFLTSRVLSPWGKLRLLLEPLAPARRDRGTESIHAFASRRIGRAAADVLVDAMVSGVFGGDARRLELETTFPKMRRMESEHGSLFRAMLAGRKRARATGGAAGGPAGPGGTLTSFRDGLQELIDALALALGPGLRLETPVTRLSTLGDRGFRVHLREGAPLDVDAVVLACPAWCAAPLVETMDGELAGALADIPSAPLAVVHVGYRRDAVGPQPDGFGFLVPRGEGPRILGALWPTCMFDGRAPEGSSLTTVMVGGAHDPALAALPEADLLRLVREDLAATLGIHANPYFERIIRHPRGIPQYTLGHRERLEAVERRLAALPGLWITGNSLRGVSVNACVAETPGVAEAALSFLERRRPGAAS
jgi:oxygen-dependent protoporphyrinogen oxidase